MNELTPRYHATACSDMPRQCDSRVLDEDRNYDKHYLSEFQLAELNQAFKTNPFMKAKEKRVLAARLNLSENFTLCWFSRKRANWRERFLEGDVVIR